MWHKGEGGSQIATCLFKELTSVPCHVTHVVLFSDAHGVQSKNTHVAVMFLPSMQAAPHIQAVDHKFMISGQSHGM
jgi:hypothetical protein